MGHALRELSHASMHDMWNLLGRVGVRVRVCVCCVCHACFGGWVVWWLAVGAEVGGRWALRQRPAMPKDGRAPVEGMWKLSGGAAVTLGARGLPAPPCP